MEVTSAKENILKRIRQALSNPVPLPFPQSEGINSVFLPATEDLEVFICTGVYQYTGQVCILYK